MAVYFVPLNVPAFIESNPEFAELSVPSAPGLVLDAVCQSCGDLTEAVVEFVAGTRLGTRAESFEQPVYVCEACQRDQQRTRTRKAGVVAARIAVSVVVATLVSVAMREWLGFSGITSTAGWLLALPVTYILGRVAFGGPRAVGRWQTVEVFWFRDPRKGEGAEFLCVRIDNPDRAARFRELNPHAIDDERWEASYSRPGD